MPLDPILRGHIDAVCAYLATEEGDRELRRIMAMPYKGGTLGYVAAVAQIVVVRCGVHIGETLQAVTDEIVTRKLAA